MLPPLLPSNLFLELGAEQQVSEEKDVPQFASAFHQLHHEAVLQKLPVLQRKGPHIQEINNTNVLYQSFDALSYTPIVTRTQQRGDSAHNGLNGPYTSSYCQLALCNTPKSG